MNTDRHTYVSADSRELEIATVLASEGTVVASETHHRVTIQQILTTVLQHVKTQGSQRVRIVDNRDSMADLIMREGHTQLGGVRWEKFFLEYPRMVSLGANSAVYWEDTAAGLERTWDDPAAV